MVKGQPLALWNSYSRYTSILLFFLCVSASACYFICEKLDDNTISTAIPLLFFSTLLPKPNTKTDNILSTACPLPLYFTPSSFPRRLDSQLNGCLIERPVCPTSALSLRSPTSLAIPSPALQSLRPPCVVDEALRKRIRPKTFCTLRGVMIKVVIK